jgi:hypothetical protein
METIRSILISADWLLFEVLEADSRESLGQTVKPQIHHRRGVKRKQLADEAADDGDSERVPQFRTRAGAKGGPPNSAALVVIVMGRKRIGAT